MPGLILEYDFAEACPFDGLDAVMHRETFVQERVLCRHQIRNAAIAAQDAVHEKSQFLLHQVTRIEQITGMRKLPAVRNDLVELGDIEPLEREILDERKRSVVAEHAAQLGIEDSRFAESILAGLIEQRLIRHTAP